MSPTHKQTKHIPLKIKKIKKKESSFSGNMNGSISYLFSSLCCYEWYSSETAQVVEGPLAHTSFIGVKRDILLFDLLLNFTVLSLNRAVPKYLFF